MRHLFDTVESWHCTLHADVVVVVVLVVLVVFVLDFIRFLATNDCQAGKSFGERQRRKIITWLQWLTKSMSYIRSASVIQSLQYCNMKSLSWHITAVCWFSSLSLKNKSNHCLWQGTRMKRHYFTSWCAKMASFTEQRSGAYRILWCLVSSTPMLKPMIKYWNVSISVCYGMKGKTANYWISHSAILCMKSSQLPCQMCKTSRKTCDKLCTGTSFLRSTVVNSKRQVLCGTIQNLGWMEARRSNFTLFQTMPR